MFIIIFICGFYTSIPSSVEVKIPVKWYYFEDRTWITNRAVRKAILFEIVEVKNCYHQRSNAVIKFYHHNHRHHHRHLPKNKIARKLYMSNLQSTQTLKKSIYKKNDKIVVEKSNNCVFKAEGVLWSGFRNTITDFAWE